MCQNLDSLLTTTAANPVAGNGFASFGCTTINATHDLRVPQFPSSQGGESEVVVSRFQRTNGSEGKYEQSYSRKPGSFQLSLNDYCHVSKKV